MGLTTQRYGPSMVRMAGRGNRPVTFVALTIFTFVAYVIPFPSQAQRPVQPAKSYIFRPPVSASLVFSEPPSGGELVLVNRATEGRAVISIETNRAMSSEELIHRLRDRIVAYPIRKFMGSVHLQNHDNYVGQWLREITLDLRGYPGEYVLGGTEIGLGIPRPVGSVSAGFDWETGHHTFRWHEKDGEYTQVAFSDRVGHGNWVSGSRSTATQGAFQTAHSESPCGSTYKNVYVVGYAGELPSNASSIYTNSTEQIEYFFRPFTNGIASNWTGWKVGQGESLQLDPLTYSGLEREAPIVPSQSSSDLGQTGRCVQRIRSDSSGGDGGIYRFFIAQTPGRVYRPALRCQIVEEAAEFEGNWSFEIMTGTLHPELAQKMDHATQVVNGDAWHDLSTAGSQISRWYLEHTVTPEGDWMMKQTGSIDDAIPQKDIVLGDEETAIFFCVRLKGVKPRGVLLDGVRLVDVTDGFANAKLREKVL